jgi:hypothetical protein
MGTNKTLGGGASRGTTMDYKEYLSFLSEAGLVGDKGAIDRKLAIDTFYKVPRRAYLHSALHCSVQQHLR